MGVCGMGYKCNSKGAWAQVWIEWDKTDDEGAPWIKAVRSDVGSEPYVALWRLDCLPGAHAMVLTG